ncbi:MAG: AraC family transcriptional regulator [Thermoanaerobaculia bacterium]
MNKRDTIRPKLVPPRGILRARADLPAPGYGRYWPAEDLAPFVEHFWTVSWDLETPETREVLPHPSVQIVLEAGASRVAGVPRGRFTRQLEGRGRVLGTKFRPGGFRPFIHGPVSALTGRVTTLSELFGPLAHALEAEALAPQDAVAGFERVQEFLRGRHPVPDDNIDLVSGIAERVAKDREIMRVEQLVQLSGLSVRALQRLFSEYVGVSPKWIIQRYRLHEAAQRIVDAPDPGAENWASLALDLGYSDQAHFIRDFRRIVGQTPAVYARSIER